MVSLLYVSLARPHLKYAAPVWNPFLNKDIEKLQDIQHKMTRLVPTLRKNEYGLRLSKLRLTTLETRRKRGNLIEFYKIINGSDQVKWKNMPKKIYEPANICTFRNEFFMNRVILLWNELPQKVRESVTLNSLKAGLGKIKLFLT